MADPAYQAIQRAKNQADSGNPVGAAETLEAYLATDPRNAKARVQLAHVYNYSLKDTERAVFELGIVLDDEPENEEALKALVTIQQVKKKETEAADATYMKLLSICPDADLYNSYAYFLKMQKADFTGAGEYYKKAIALKPNKADFHRNYATLLLNDLKDWTEAKKELEILMDLVPGDVKVVKAYDRLMRQKFDKNGNVKKGLFGRPKK